SVADLDRWEPPRLAEAPALLRSGAGGPRLLQALAHFSAAARLACTLPNATSLLRAAAAIATGSEPGETAADPFSRRAVPELVSAARGLAKADLSAVDALVS